MHDRGPEPKGGTLVESSELDELFAAGGEVGAHAARLDWSRTPVGPPETWPRSLTTVVRMLLTSRFAMWMAWGEELTFFCNDAYRRDTLGAKFPWALGRSAREVWAEIWPDIGPRVDHVMRSGEATWDEALLLFLERSGYPEETYHTFSYSPLSDDDGRIAGMLCVVSEETERVIGERHLATLRDLGSEATTAPDPAAYLRGAAVQLGGNPRSLPFTLTYLFDDDGTTARLAATSGIEPGHPAAPAVLDAAGPDGLWPAAELAAGATVVVGDLGARFATLPTGAWERRPQRALVVPLPRQQGGRPYGFLVAALNPHRPLGDGYRAFVGLVAQRLASGVASARSYEAERRRAEQLAELDRAKTAFFSNVSHELRTPLTLMLGPLGDALAGAGRLEAGEVALVQRNGLRLLKLVNGLLEFSRIEAGRLQAAFRPVDLAALTAELAGSFREATERAGLRLEIACDPLPEPVYVDPDLWERIVLNLLSNAFKFTLEGGIAVRLESDGRAVRLVVSDSGAGIPEDELAQLFQRFHRVTTARARSHEGSGIGLALVKELTELHGGEVEASSTLGEGSRFEVRLRFGREHLPADQVVGGGALLSGDGRMLYVQEALGWLPAAEAEARAALAGEVRDLDPVALRAQPNAGTAGARVLVADDNADLRAYLVRLLSPHVEVDVVGDGATALARLREDQPDLLISDVMMPGLDGFALLREIRDDPATSELPVIMLSARAGEEAAIEGLEAGADDYLPKPFSGRDLVARVRANLELARVRRAAAAELREERERLRRTLDQLALQRDVLSMVAAGAPLERTLDRIVRGVESLLAGHGARVSLLLHGDDGERIELGAAAGPGDGGASAAGSESGIAWSTPIRAADGRLVGSFSIDHGRPYEPSREERQLVEFLTGTVAVAIERFRDGRARARQLAELQSSLLPGRLPAVPGMQLAVAFHPATRGLEVGGDFYDVFPLKDGAFGFVIGDVCGHGAAAAAVTALTRHTTRAVALLESDPSRVLATVNDALLASDYDRFCTAVYGRVEPVPGGLRLELASAGHPLPLLRRASGAIETVASHGTLLGVVADPDLPHAVVELSPGDLLLMHTDGLTERNPRLTGDDEAALAELLGAIGQGSAQEVLGELQARALGDAPHHLRDDVAILVLQADRPGAAARQPLHERTLLCEVYPADRGAVPRARAALRDAARRAGAEEEQVEALALALSEAVSNVVLHAYRDAAARADGAFEVTLRQLGSALELLVDDRGCGMAPRDDSPGLGLGLSIISTLSDAFEVRERPAGGTQLAMRFALGPADG